MAAETAPTFQAVEEMRPARGDRPQLLGHLRGQGAHLLGCQGVKK